MCFQRGNGDGQHAYENMVNTTNHQRSTNQNHKEIPLGTHYDADNQRQILPTSFGKDVEKLESSQATGRNGK